VAASRRPFLRWLAVGGMVLAAEFSIAIVAIAVAGRSPSGLVAKSTVSPSPSAVPSSPSPVSQAARPWSAGAFYPPSGKAVFFGGVASSGPTGLQGSNETWTWDGANWRQLHPLNSPPARFNAGLAYDAARQVLVLFGGGANSSGEFLRDTWTWDGTNWKQMSPAQTPTFWVTAPMTYDATRKEVLLFVGLGDWPLTPPDETWSWDGTTWARILTPTDPKGAQQSTGTIAFDSKTGQTLFVSSGGTWVLDGGDWRRLTGGGTTGREYAVVDDPARGVLVEVGSNGDTWTWDGSAWTAQNPPVMPSPRTGAAIAFDSVRQKVVLFGGFAGNPYQPGTALTDTWEWDGTTWKKVA
jgi:hypothetical protein